MTVDMSRLDVPASVVEARAAALARRNEIRELHHAQAAEARRDGDPDGAVVALQNLAIREESWAMTDEEARR